jgi:hypothetical protein
VSELNKTLVLVNIYRRLIEASAKQVNAFTERRCSISAASCGHLHNFEGFKTLLKSTAPPRSRKNTTSRSPGGFARRCMYFINTVCNLQHLSNAPRLRLEKLELSLPYAAFFGFEAPAISMVNMADYVVYARRYSSRVGCL